MKKVWILMTIIAMMLSVAACRSEGKGGAADEGAEGQQASVTEQDGQATQDENTENEQGETTVPGETAQGEQEAEVPGTSEDTPPATTSQTESAYPEDPELRAQAEKLKEKGVEAYSDFCYENDIRNFWDYSIEEDFVDNEVCVTLKKVASVHGDPLPDFSCIEYKSIEESKYYSQQLEKNFRRHFVITLKKNDKQAVLDAIKKLQQLDYVLYASPNFKYYPDIASGV